MEGLGEFLFGGLQPLLGFFQLGDVTHHHDQSFGGIQLKGFGGDQSGEGLAVAAQEGHFQVADAGGLYPLQQAGAYALDAPDIQFSGGFSYDCFGAQADLVFECLIDLHQAAVRQPGDDQDVRALLEHRGEFLFRKLQRFLGALGFADVDHQAAQHGLVAVFDQADDVPHPQAASIGGDHPVVDTVVAVGPGFGVAIGFGAGQVRGVDDVAPEARDQPVGTGVTQQFLGVGRHVAVGEIADAGFPGDRGKALHQAAIVVFAAAQFLFEGDPAGNFRAEPTIDPNNHGQHDAQQQHGRQPVEQHIRPERPVVDDVADPALLDGLGLSRADVGQDFIEDAHQHLVVLGYAHGQLIAVRRFAADVQAFQLELAQAPHAGRQIAHYGVDLVGGQGLQRSADIGHGHQVEVRVVSAQQFMGRVVFHHGHLQPVQVFEAAWLRAAFVGEDDDGEVEIRPGKRQETLAFRCGHDARQQVELVVAGLFQHGAPVHRLDQFYPDAKAILHQPHIISGQALVATIFIAVFKGWPRGVDAQAQLLVVRQPATLFIGESQRASRCGPGQQRQQ
eukprot:gene13428-biopygen13468